MDFTTGNQRPMSVDSLSKIERLKLSILHGTKSVCKATEDSCKNKITFDKDSISLISTLVWKKLEEMGFDLKCFAKHAKNPNSKKTIVRSRDVLLLARRNPSLKDHLTGLVKVKERRQRKSNSGLAETKPTDIFDVEVELNVESNDAPGKADKASTSFHPLSDDNSDHEF